MDAFADRLPVRPGQPRQSLVDDHRPIAGHDGGTLKGDRHLVYPKGENPMTNLQLTMLQKLGVPVEHFGDSTGTLKELTGLS